MRPDPSGVHGRRAGTPRIRKALPNQPFDGIFIRSFNNCYIGDQPLHTTPQGAAVLVTKDELPKLRVNATHLVAVENARCVWELGTGSKILSAA